MGCLPRRFPSRRPRIALTGGHGGEGNCRISKSGGIGSFLAICTPRAAALAPVAVAAPDVALRARTHNPVCRRGTLNVRFAPIVLQNSG
jgi:hypothetical protein